MPSKLVILGTLVVTGPFLLSGLALTGEAPASPGASVVPEDQSRRIEDLEARIKALETGKAPAPVEGEKKADSWTERVKFMADLRLRFENVEEDDKRDRERGRFRARVGFTAEVNEEVDFRFRLTTCNDGTPTSCDQTFGGADSKKPIWVDCAHVDYHPKIVPGLNLIAGKMEMPLFAPGKNEMLWDGNLTPEGLAVKYALGDGAIRPFAAAGGFWIEERENGPDSALFGLQGGVKIPLPGKDTCLTVGVGYIDFTHLENQPTLWKAARGYGNTLDGTDCYRYDFNELEVFAELGFSAMDIPVTVFGDFVRNLEAGDEDTGFAAGLRVGRLAKPGDLAFRYDYRLVEKDATVGLYSERGTDRRGHEVGIEVQALKNVQVATTFCVDEVGIADDGDEHDYRRLRLQAVFKF
jgi:hypothetical protein